jgi:3-isopropylmalate dehydrogenase
MDTATRRISVLPGDGIGTEVIDVALDQLPGHFEIEKLDVGAERYLSTGRLLEDEDLTKIRESDALLFGAIGDPRVPDGVLERGVLLRLRKELDLYVNLRPFPELGVTFVRENTEGPYSGVGSREPDKATETSVNTRAAIQRCARYAFELAASGGSRLTWVHKTNVLVHAGSLWAEIVKGVAQDFPEILLDYQHADAAAYLLVMEPERFDVVLTDNLFGDLLSDLAAGLSGGLGRAASANLHPEPATRPYRCIGLFEPVHGSAPDIAGTGRADPTAAVRAAQMLIDALDKEPMTISRNGR